MATTLVKSVVQQQLSPSDGRLPPGHMVSIVGSYNEARDRLTIAPRDYTISTNQDFVSDSSDY